MKKLAIIFLIAASLHARADLTIVEHVETVAKGPNQDQDITLKIKGDKIRFDVQNGQGSIIFDTGTGDAIGMIHQSKMLVKVSMDQLKAIIEQGKKRGGNAAIAAGQSGTSSASVSISAAPDTGDAPKIVDTGKQEKVGDYNAEIYTIETPQAKSTLWITKDFPDYAAIRQLTKKALGTIGKLGISKMPDFSAIDGVAVKMETVANERIFTVTLASVNHDAIADAEFLAPPDYTEIQMSQLSALFGGSQPRQPQAVQPDAPAPSLPNP